MKTLLPVLPILLLSGCASSPIDREAEDIRFKINEAHDAALVPADAPFLWQKIQSEEYQREFAKKICKIDDAKKVPLDQIEACEKKLTENYTALLNERYFAVVSDHVKKFCEAHPIDCQDDNLFEKKVREMHNKNVEISRAEKLRQLEAARVDAKARAAFVRSVQLQNLSNSLINASATLNQTFNGGGNRSSCTTTPNVFGGQNISCN